MLPIEKSTIAYKKEFSAMILSSAEYFRELFGEGIQRALESLYIREKNLFSYQHCYVAKYDNEIASMVLCYDYNTKRREDLNTGWLLFRFTKSAFMKNLSVLMQMNKKIGHLVTGDFYISNITTFEQFKRQGFAKKLLLKCENIAKNRHMKRIKLDVEKENIPATSLYKTLGYIVTEEFSIKSKRMVLEFQRMVKSIA